MRTHRKLPIDWSSYRLKAEVVAREITSLRPLRFTAVEIPPVDGENFALLRDSVEANGVCEPLTITPDAWVVDGQARLRAAQEVGLHQVPTRVLEADGGERDYALWAAIVNLGRRHLAPAQRFVAVQAVLAMLEEQARARQEATRFGQKSQPPVAAAASPTLDAPASSTDVRSQVGALVGVSRSHAAKMITIIKRGSPDLHGAIASGRLSIHRAHQILKKPGASCAARSDAAAREVVRNQLEGTPVTLLRTVAARIPLWLDESSRWTTETRVDFLEALQNLMDSCELVFRRLPASGPPS